MPELPEVERAVVQLRRHLVGRRILSLELHHAALKRQMTARQRRSVAGARVVAVRRRGKHQLIDLDDGRILHAHFRMTGDWATGAAATAARYPRATIELDDGTRVVLDDPRALSSIQLDEAGTDPVPGLGPDADDPLLDAAWLAERLRPRRIAIKVALLDQRLVSGIGNIYAAEALWRARIDPRRRSASLSTREPCSPVSGPCSSERPARGTPIAARGSTCMIVSASPVGGAVRRSSESPRRVAPPTSVRNVSAECQR